MELQGEVPEVVLENEKEKKTKAEKEEVLPDHACPICKDLLYQPVTLLCQHTFCYHCIQEHESISRTHNDDEWEGYPASRPRCPSCRRPYALPPMYNTMLEQFLACLYFKRYDARFQEVEGVGEEEGSDGEGEEEDVGVRERRLLVQRIRRQVWNAIAMEFEDPGASSESDEIHESDEDEHEEEMQEQQVITVVAEWAGREGHPTPSRFWYFLFSFPRVFGLRAFRRGFSFTLGIASGALLAYSVVWAVAPHASL